MMLTDLLQLELRSIRSKLSRWLRRWRARPTQIRGPPIWIAMQRDFPRHASELAAAKPAGHDLKPPPDVVQRATDLSDEISRLALSAASVAAAVAIVSVVSQLDLYIRPLLAGPKGPPIVGPDD